MSVSKMSNDIISLTPLKKEDSKKLYEWINDRETRICSYYYTPISELQHDEWFNKIQKRDDLFIFAIRTADGDIVGTCQVYNINWVYRSAMFQIRIGKENRNKGIGTKSIKKLLQFTFFDINMNRISLEVFENNIPAIKLYTKCGFIKEGELKEAIYIDNEYRNLIIMGITRGGYNNATRNNSCDTPT